MEVVEVSPPYDSGDITSLLACRSILDMLAVLVAEGKARAPSPVRSVQTDAVYQ